MSGDQWADDSGPYTGTAVLSADEFPDGVVVADSHGRIVTFNAMAHRLLRTPPSAALGRDFREVLPLRDVDGRDWWECTDPYNGLRTRSRQPERLLSLADGRKILTTARYVRDVPLGELTRLVITLRDAAPRERNEQSSSDLVLTVAHELRSPLTSVKGFTATLLAKWDRLTDRQKTFMLETVNADAERVTRLISDLLGASRIEAGSVELRRRVVDLPEQARKVLAGQVIAGEPEDRFRLEIRGSLPQMWLDGDKIEQIMGNLVENALRHGAGTVSVVIEPHEGGAAVSVRDEGGGVAPEAVLRVFRQFWRGGRRGGTGLGLFIVKGLIEAHGGAITINRAPNGGAEFRFTVPAGVPELT